MPDPFTCMATAGHPIEGVIHVGAREGQELPDYRPCGASPCIYVTATRTIYDRIAQSFDGDPWQIPVLAICSDGPIGHNYAGTGAYLPVKVAPNVPPIPNYTIDELVTIHSPKRPPNLIVLDASGSELLALRGATGTLSSATGVFVQVSETRQHPIKCTLDEVRSFLERHGLYPRWMSLDRNGHGQAFFSRPPLEMPRLPTYGPNLALGKSAAQSSLSEWSHPDVTIEAGGAINGNITGEYAFHTDIEDTPWWLVDLGDSHQLHEIRVYNRLGEFRARASTLRIIISEDGTKWWEVHDQGGYTFGGADGRPLRVLLDPCSARYIAIRLAERNWLHLDEIEIY